MTLSPTITLAAIPYSMLARPYGDLSSGPQIRRVMFYLQVVQDEKRCFYECAVDGCAGCGCPSFEIDASLVIPDWVLDHLRIHVKSAHSPIAGKD